MKTLYVILKTKQEIEKGWGIPIIFPPPYYVQCNRLGVINWDSTSIYPTVELIERNDVKIIK